MQVSGFRARTNIKRLARDPVLLAVILLVTASLAIFILYPLVEVATTSLDVGGGRLGFGVYAEVAKTADTIGSLMK